MNQQIDEQITTLRSSIREMSVMADTRLQTTLEAWFNHDADLAESIRHADDEIDEMEVRVTALCHDILATHQPAGDQLRYTLSMMRIASSLERVGDLSRLIAKRVQKLERANNTHRPAIAKAMGDRVRAMYKDFRTALDNEDAQLADAVRAADRLVDLDNKEVFQWVAASVKQDAANAEQYMHILVLCRAMERIADIIENMAEDLVFYIRGADVRHQQVAV